MNAIYAALLAGSFLLIESLIGGTRLVFSLPSYAILVVIALLSAVTVRRGPGRAHVPSLIVSAVFFTYILVRAALSPWDYLWWTDFYQVIACLIVYGVTTFVLTDATSRVGILSAMLAFCIFEFFVGLHQFRYIDNWMPFEFRRADVGARASGTLISPIHYAGLLEALAAFALAFTFWGKLPKWGRFACGLIGLVCYAGVAISGSRGGYLSSAFSVVVFIALSFVAVQRSRPERMARVFSGAAIGVAVVLIGGAFLMYQSPDLQKRIDLILNQDVKILQYATSSSEGAKEQKLSADVRVYNWQAALDHFRQAPVFGTGAGTHLYYGRLFRRPQIQSDPIHAHCDYLELIAEYGLVGAAGMLAFLGIHLVHGWRRFAGAMRVDFGDLDEYQPARSHEVALAMGALTAVSAYLAHSVVDFNLHIPGHAMLFAFIFGILASPRADGAVNAVGWKGDLVFRAALPALGLWMLLLGLTKYPSEHFSEESRVAVRDGNFEEAVRLAKKGLTTESRNPELYAHLGGAYRGLAAKSLPGESKALLEASVEAYNRSLAIFPFDIHVLIRNAQVLDGLGRYKEARQAYETAIAHDPKLGVLYAYFAQHLLAVGRVEEARENFAMVRKLGQLKKSRIVDVEFLDAPDEPATPSAQN